MKINLNKNHINGAEKIGIVLATYNPHIPYYEKQITSLVKQSFTNWVCHIVDDCSLADIQEKIKKIASIDSRFILHFHEINVGSYYNFERGLQYCKQDVEITAIAFCDQDDIWKENKLSFLIEKLRYEQALLIHSDLEIIDLEDKLVHNSCWLFERRYPEKLTTELLLLKNTVTGCSMMFCTQLLPFILPFPKQEKLYWHHDLWIALIASRLGKISHVREPLVKYRQHNLNVVGAARDVGKINREVLIWLKQKCRITGKSYLVHKALSQSFYNRFNDNTFKNPFDDRIIDFGFRILMLGLYSLIVGYGAEGVAARLFILKFIFNLKRILKLN